MNPIDLADRRTWHLRRLMDFHDHTPTTLARLCRFHAETTGASISTMLSGAQPRDLKLVKIAAVLEVDPGVFYSPTWTPLDTKKVALDYVGVRFDARRAGDRPEYIAEHEWHAVTRLEGTNLYLLGHMGWLRTADVERCAGLEIGPHWEVREVFE